MIAKGLLVKYTASSFLSFPFKQKAHFKWNISTLSGRVHPLEHEHRHSGHNPNPAREFHSTNINGKLWLNILYQELLKLEILKLGYFCIPGILEFNLWTLFWALFFLLKVLLPIPFWRVDDFRSIKCYKSKARNESSVVGWVFVCCFSSKISTCLLIPECCSTFYRDYRKFHTDTFTAGIKIQKILKYFTGCCGPLWEAIDNWWLAPFCLSSCRL